MACVLADKTIFVFDWDGTLLDSMGLKFRTFSGVLAAALSPLLPGLHSRLQEQVRIRYQELSGSPRREIVKTIVEEFGLAENAIDFDTFSAALTQVNRKELLAVTLFPDSLLCLQRLMAKATLYISSSVPQEELTALVTHHLPPEMRAHLAGVFGSDGAFTKGPAHIDRILRETTSARQDVIFFGDDRADAELCKQAGVDCVLVDRQSRLGALTHECRRVTSFLDLLGELPSQQPNHD